MIIKSIELADYRNYDSLVLQFDRGTNILYGDNAQGKTNILEAIYVAATTKSHKGSKDREIVNFDKEEAHIRTYLEKDGKEIRVDMHLRKSKSKGIAIDGQKIKKAADLLGLCNVVFFSPEDLGIIKNGPSERRRFVDMELCQLDNFYLYNLNHYNKIVNQRNKLLKDMYMNPDLNVARDLQNAGAAAVMPLAAPIGSNKGLATKAMIQVLIDEIDLPVIVDAGIGKPSQACEAMEMGAAAIMANTAIATAGDVPEMAAAFKLAIEAGRKAYLTGMGRVLARGGSASDPLTGFLR